MTECTDMFVKGNMIYMIGVEAGGNGNLVIGKLNDDGTITSFTGLTNNADIDNVLELEDELASMPRDKFSQYASTMQMGDWVDYTTPEGFVLRAKLSWKSEVTSRCLFVDNRGIKAMDIRVSELAEGLRQKTISLVGQEKTPLVERVLTGMKNMMQSQQSKPSMA
jgi:hypothetical protein